MKWLQFTVAVLLSRRGPTCGCGFICRNGFTGGCGFICGVGQVSQCKTTLNGLMGALYFQLSCLVTMTTGNHSNEATKPTCFRGRCAIGFWLFQWLWFSLLYRGWGSLSPLLLLLWTQCHVIIIHLHSTNQHQCSLMARPPPSREEMGLWFCCLYWVSS